MARSSSRARPRGVPARALLAAVAGAIALTLLLVTGSLGPRAMAPAPTPSALVHPSGVVVADSNVSVNVTWNGAPIGQATSASTAFVLGPGQSADVVFSYTEAAGIPAVTNASLVLRFLDVNLSTESIRAATVVGPSGSQSGSAQLNWTFGSLLYLTEGVYEVDAELLGLNGTLLFQLPFYVDARAPYLIGSAIAAFAIVLGTAEAFWVVTVVRSRRVRRGRYRGR